MKLCKQCTSFTSHPHSWCGMVWYRTLRVKSPAFFSLREGEGRRERGERGVFSLIEKKEGGGGWRERERERERERAGFLNLMERERERDRDRETQREVGVGRGVGRTRPELGEPGRSKCRRVRPPLARLSKPL